MLNSEFRNPHHRQNRAFAFAVDLAILCAATVACYIAQSLERPITAVLVYLIGVIAIGARSGLYFGLAAAIAASFVYNFFLSDPVFQLGVSTADEIVPLIAFTVSALVTGPLVGRLTDGARAARSAEAKSAFLLKISEELQPAITVSDVIAAARRSLPIGRVVDFDVRLNGVGEGPTAVSQSGPTTQHYALRGSSGEQGVMTVRFAEDRFGADDAFDLQAVANLLSLAVERCVLLEQVAESSALKRSEELKTAILSSLSHDLRTPITAIEAATSSLESCGTTLSDGERQAMFGAIHDQCGKLNRYTADLLSMGRIQSGISPDRFEVVDIVDILGVALASIRQAYPAIEIAKALDQPIALIRANPTMLEQVLFNILENAAIHARGAPIDIGLTRRDGSYVLDICDQGPGVPEADRSHIFERFHRSDRSPDPRGSGLGLYIARGFTEAFGGQTALTSPVADGGGACVTVRLPVWDAPLESSSDLP